MRYYHYKTSLDAGMNWDAVGAIGDFVAALAVMVTLIYLAIQLRGNTAASRATEVRRWQTQ